MSEIASSCVNVLYLKKKAERFFPLFMSIRLCYIRIGCWLALLREAFRKNQNSQSLCVLAAAETLLYIL